MIKASSITSSDPMNLLEGKSKAGSEGGMQIEDFEKDMKCEVLKNEYIKQISQTMEGSPLYTRKDFSLEERGINMFASKRQVAELKESLQRVTETRSTLEEAESYCRFQISQAQSNGYITTNTAKYWLNKMSSEEYHWSQKADFIFDKLPDLVKNWRELSKDTEKVKEAVKNNKELAAIPEVKKILANKGMAGYKRARNRVSKALASIEAHKRDRTELYNEAKNALEHAAKSRKILSPHKVGMWLYRIFKSGTSNQNIIEFVRGKGEKSLHGLMNRWASVKYRYDVIETKRVTKGTPRGFQFANKSSFLEWHYSKRLAYVDEAEKRFSDVASENPKLLAIRRELDMGDWREAGILILEAENMDLTDAESRKLKSMRRYWMEHKFEKKEDEESSGLTTKEEARIELDRLYKLAGPLEQLYRKTEKVGKFDCLKSLLYNRIWCREKGFVLDEEKEREYEAKAAEVTRDRIKHGDKGDHTLGEVDCYKESSIRGYANTSIYKSQILYCGSGGFDALVTKMAAEDSSMFRYWTTLIPKGVSYSHQSFCVRTLNHKIKRCLRTINGPDVTPKPKKQSSAKQSSSYSLAS